MKILLGYAWIINNQQNTKKSAYADFGDPTKVESDLAYHLKYRIPQHNHNVKFSKKSVEVAGFAPAGPWMISQVLYSSTPTPSSTLPKPSWLVQNLSKMFLPMDSSGNARTGTINGNPLWSTGKYGKGIKMDGTGDNVQVGDF